MMSGANIAEVASLVGDPARANILVALMDGQALTASELAFLAGIAPSTASAHLAKLVEARLLAVVAQGRHRYFRLASPLVARTRAPKAIGPSMRRRTRLPCQSPWKPARWA